MKKYYTVEQVAEVLTMHPKTIQKYIREGKLPAEKIGKGWRILENDLQAFLGKSDSAKNSKEKAVASAVIDIPVEDAGEASDIERILIAALNSKPDEYGRTALHVQYVEYESKIRVTLWGNLLFMQNVFGIVLTVTEQAE